MAASSSSTESTKCEICATWIANEDLAAHRTTHDGDYDDSFFDAEFFATNNIQLIELEKKAEETFEDRRIIAVGEWKEQIEIDIHSSPRLELSGMPTVFHTLPDTQVFYVTDDENFSVKTGIISILHFDVVLEHQELELENGHTTVYTSPTLSEIIFSFPEDFEFEGNHKYRFLARCDDTRKKTHGKYLYCINDVSTIVHYSYYEWNYDIMNILLAKIPSSNDCDKIKDGIRAIFDTYVTEIFNEKTAKMPLHAVYTDVLRELIGNECRNYFETIKDIKEFFFGQLISYLYNNFIPSYESLLALPVSTIIILHRLFSAAEKDLEFKQYYFRLLFFRPDEKISQQRVKDFHTVVAPMIPEIFTCKSRMYTWKFPTYSVHLFERLIEIVFNKFNMSLEQLSKSPYWHRNEIRVLQTITQTAEAKKYDVAIDLDPALTILKRMETNRTDPVDTQSALRKLEEFGSLIFIAPKVVMLSEDYMRAHMMVNAICTIAARFKKFHPTSVDDVGYFGCETGHPNRCQRIPIKTLSLSGEQMRAIEFIENCPIMFLPGIGGSGKTGGVMSQVAKCFQRNRVLFVASQRRTNENVGKKYVSKFALTTTRLIVLHNMWCLCRYHARDRARVEKVMVSKTDEAKKKGMAPPTVVAGIKKYYCAVLDIAFNRCVYEDILLLCVDEVSNINIADMQRLLHIMSVCNKKGLRVIMAGDDGQLAAVAPGNLFGDLEAMLPEATNRLQIDHRNIGDDTIWSLSNNDAVRTGQYEHLRWQRVTPLIKNLSYLDGVDLSRDSDGITEHFIEIEKIPGYMLKYDPRDTSRLNAATMYLQKVIRYLLLPNNYLSRLFKYGETSEFQILAPTNALCDLISDIITREVHMRRNNYYIEIHNDYRRWLNHYLIGMKIKYLCNWYTMPNGNDLGNNMTYVIVKIEYIVLKKKTRNTKRSRENELIAELSEHNSEQVQELLDDLITDTSETSLESGNKGYDECYAEMERYLDPETILDKYGYENIIGTNHPQPTWIEAARRGMRLLVVPSDDIDKNGNVTSMDNAKYIPFTPIHRRNMVACSAFTIHGSQGTDADQIIVFVPDYYEQYCVREMLYTGITRKRRSRIIISQQDTIRKICENPQKERSNNIGKFMRRLLEDKGALPLLTMPKKFSSKTLIALEEDAKILRQQQEDIREFRERTRDRLPYITKFNIPEPVVKTTTPSTADSVLKRQMMAKARSRTK